MTDRDFHIRYGSRLMYVLGAALAASVGIVFLILMLLGTVELLVPILLIVFVVTPLNVLRFLRGDRLRLTEDEIVSTGGKHGGALRYEDIEEIRLHGDRVEIKVRGQVGWWRRFNFAPGLRKFVLVEDADAFLSEMEIRLGQVRRYPMPNGGVALVRSY
ncbi:MAG: hypothetical protein Q7R32_02140 [Dehalococcoidia bacterium]|nr:hypothetical protein [Dehalococcoidia bacterium]